MVYNPKEYTTIQVKKTVKVMLKQFKQHRKETYNDILERKFEVINND